MTWEAWTTDHPDTALTRDTTAEEWNGLISKEIMLRFLTDGGGPTALKPRGLMSDDDRLGMLTGVIGVEINGYAKAYPVETLKEQGTVEDEVGRTPVTVSFDTGGNRAEVSVDGQPENYKRTRWLDWFEFHPETAVHE